MENEEKKAIKLLEKYNQHHIVKHMEKLDNEDKGKLINQINEIDFEEITYLYEKTQKQREKRNAKIEPLKTINANKIPLSQKQEYIEVGKQIIKENKFAVVTMAGGQGTRLRTQWTKGKF